MVESTSSLGENGTAGLRGTKRAIIPLSTHVLSPHTQWVAPLCQPSPRPGSGQESGLTCQAA